MTNLIQTIKEYVAQAHVNYASTRERIMRKAATANQDREPTVDRFDRLHAPFDGYIWQDREYAGGSYLPMPPEFWEMLEEQTGRSMSSSGSRNHGSTSRIKVSTDEAEEIKKACDKYAEVKIGRTWDDNTSCYVYISTTRKKLNVLIDEFRAEQEALIKAERDAERAAKQALKGKAPTGRQTVRGRIIAFKTVERESYGYYDRGVDFKMLVELDNLSTVWGTEPAAIGDADVGTTIEFTATFTPSDDDDTHAFYKRPAKVKIISE